MERGQQTSRVKTHAVQKDRMFGKSKLLSVEEGGPNATPLQAIANRMRVSE